MQGGKTTPDHFPFFSLTLFFPPQFAHGGLNYGFVEFADHAAAEIALQTMNGRRVNLQVRLT